MLTSLALCVACTTGTHIIHGDGFSAPVPDGFTRTHLQFGYRIRSDADWEGVSGTISIARVDQLVYMNDMNDCISRANRAAQIVRGRVLAMEWVELEVGEACDFTVVDRFDRILIRRIWVPEREDVIFIRVECEHHYKDEQSAIACAEVINGIVRS